MKIINKWIAVLTAFLMTFAMLPAGLAFAQTTGNVYYVSKTAGNPGDTPGSEANPFTGFADAVAALQPGDTLIIKAGDYNEYFNLVSLKGTADAPITIKGEGEVKISGSNNNSYTGKYCVGNIQDCEYVRVSNINFHFVPVTADEAQTLLVVSCKNVTVSNCLFTAVQNGDYAPYAQIRIQGNEDCTIDSNEITGGGTSACYLWGNISKVAFTNNIITTYYGLNFQGVSDCKILNNVFATGGPAFYGGTYTNNIIVNNIFTGEVGSTIDNTNTCEYNAYTSEPTSVPASSTNVIASAASMFAAAGDYHLAGSSPCIAKGSSAAYVPEYDFEGNLRRIPSDIGPYSYGKTFYVSAAGSDTNDGLSKAAPFATFAAAVAALNAEPGSSLMVEGGPYTEALVLDGIGTADGVPVIVKTYNGRVSLTGSAALTIRNSYHVDISGFDVNGENAEPAVLLQGANGCRFHDCTITNGAVGLKIDGDTANCDIYNNDLENGSGYDVYLKNSTDNRIYNNIFTGYYGIYNDTTFTNTVITNNVFQNSNSGYVLNDMVSGSVGNIIQNNIFSAPMGVSSTTDNAVDYNLYDVSIFAEGIPTGAGEHSKAGDPAFQGGSYRIGINSDCRDAGTDTNAPLLDRDGRERNGITDIGAYEYISTGETFIITGKAPQGTGVPVGRDTTKIQITFSETLKAGLDPADFISVVRADDSSAIAGTLSVEDLPGGGSAVTFTADQDFGYSTTYTVTVRKSITNTMDETLNSEGDVSWNFTTAVFLMDTYYIAEDGKDTNPGTIDSPKKTVSSIKDVLKPGDTVIWRAGEYDEYIVLTKEMPAGAAPITFKAYEGEKVVLRASSGSSVYATIYSLGKNQNVKFEGLTFEPTEDQDYKGNALRFYNYGGSRISVSNCTFYRCDPAISVIDELNQKYEAIEIYNNRIISDGAGIGLYFREARMKDGTYGKIYNNVVYHAKWSLNMWGRSTNLLFYNNTFADQYDTEGGRGWYDLYPVQGTYNAEASPINISENCVFKNNIFTKPIRTQLEGGRCIIDGTQNCVFDNNVYASNSLGGYVTWNYGGEGPALDFTGLQAYQDRGLEVNGRYGTVSFVNAADDARIIEADNAAIEAAASEIIPSISAPAADINGRPRTNEAGAFAYDSTLAFVGNYTGTDANGSLLKPYASIQAAIAAGAKEIQVKAGTYTEAQTISNEVKITPYDGEVSFNGPVTITGSESYNIYVKGVSFAGTVSASGRNVTIDGCDIEGELALNQADGAVITNNIFAPKAEDAIVLSGSENCLITNNVITERQTAAGFTAASTSNRFYNNTFYENEKDVDLSADSTGNIFKNNIFSTKIDNREGNTFDYNLYNADTIAQADLDSITTGIEAHAVKASPDFINAGAKDYRIYKLSECAGAGIMDEYTPAKDIKGIGRKNPPDIGAYAVTAINVNYYIDAENGSDENPGTAEAPFGTIAAGLKALRNGEAIIVKAGTYNEDMAFTSRAGQEANDYVIKADGNVILNGVVTLDNAAGVTIDGFTVNAGADGTAVSLNASPKATLSNLTIGDTKNGVSAADSEELLINKVNIRNVEKGIVLDGADKVSRADVSRTKVDNASIVAVEAKNQAVLTLDSSLINNSAEGILGTGESSFFIFNNTFYNNSGYSIDITQADGHAANLDIINNIFSRSSRGQGAFSRINKGWGFNSEYNLYDAAADEAITYFYGASQNFAATVQNGDETMGRIGDPMFKNAANGDFSLAKGSPAARNGVKSYTDFFADGSEKDIPAPAVDYAGTVYSALGQDIGAYYTPYSLKTIHLAGDNAGSADGDGTEEHPFRTFAQAINAADSGDTIIVHKGIYSGRYDIMNKHGVADAPIIIKASTDPNDPLDLKNASLPGPVFTGKNDYTDRDEEAKHECMTKIVSSSYITIEGLNITGFRGAGIWTLDCDNITLRNLRIWDIDTPQQITSGVQGILVNDTTNSIFKDLDIWDIGQTRKSQADHGAYIGGSSNCTFDGLKVSKAPGGGIQFYSGDNYNIHSTNCVIKNSVFSESNLGLILCGIEGFIITNNTFYNTWGEDLYMDWNVRNNLFQNNIFYNDRTEEYDSVYGKVKPVIVCYQNNTLKSNADGSTTEMVIGNTFRNNIYEYKTFPANCRIRSSLLPIKEFMANENAAAAGNKYTDMFAGNIGFKGSFAGATDDYEKAQRIFNDILDLKSDSDCIDKGFDEYAPTVDILGRSRIGKPDLGAYEFVSNGGGDNDDEDNNDDNNGNDNNNNGNNNNGNNNGNNNNNNNNGNNSNANEKSTIAVTGKLGSHGEVNAEVTPEQLDDAFKAAKEDGNGVRLAVIKIGEIAGAAEYVQKLPANTLTAAGADKRIKIETPVGTITVPSNMMSQDVVGNAASIELSIRLADKSEISDDLKAAIGDRPVIDLSIKADGRTIAWDNPEAPATVSVAYTPSAEELKDPEHIVVWYIDGNGEAVSVPSGRYDPATGKVTFTASHFSRYAVTFVHKTFNDTAAYGWAEKEIGVLASKGVIDGTSDTTYAPGKNISRADFIVLLVRGLGLAAKADSNFSDVSADSYYYEAVGIAKKLGITEGVGGNRFDPKAFVTRQDMMVLAGNAMRAAGKPAIAGDAGDLARFDDSSKIAAYAKTSISSLVRDGIVQGDGSLINPLGSATRAEAAVMIYRIYNK